MKTKTVLVTCKVEMYCHVEVDEGTSDEEALRVVETSKVRWFRTMNQPAEQFQVVDEGQPA